MKSAKPIDTGAMKYVFIIKINPMRERITTWPAVILAKRRIHKANGLVKSPNTSTTIIKGNKATGIPGGINPLKYPIGP